MTKRKSSSKPFPVKRRLLSPLGSPECFSEEDHDLDARSRRNIKKIGRSPRSPAAGAPATKKPATINDVKEIAANRMDFIRKSLDLSHSELLKDLEASKFRLSKRVKLQRQTSMKAMDEAERDYRMSSDRINDNVEDMKASFAEFVAETQATASRVCKVSIHELAQSFEKAIEGLRCRYGLS